jgi:uncharacterized protein YgiM (DUF1202 family)
MAQSKAELPYAGVDSVCPECGSPLAAIATTGPSATDTVRPPRAAPPVSPPYNEPAPQRAEPAFDRDRVGRAYTAQEPYQTPPRPATFEAEPSAAPRDSAMKFTQIAIVGAAIVLIGFFVWKMFLAPREVATPELPASASVPGGTVPQIVQISPPQMRRVDVVAEARSTPDAASSVVAMLPAGSLVDVTGQVQAGGLNWLRVTLPNDSSKSGFVREDQLASMGDGSLTISPVDGTQLPAVPGTPPTGSLEAVGPIQPMSPATFYVASRQANVRQEATSSSPKLGTFELADPLTVIAQRTVGARVWYQVQLPNGATGWINGGLLSATPRTTPIDAPPPKAPGNPEANSPKPPTGSEKPSSQIGEMDNQEAMRAFGPGTTLRVDATSANLRKEPGVTGNSVVESLPRDTLMSVEDVRIVDGVPWYRVTSPNRAQGWVSGRTVVQDR